MRYNEYLWEVLSVPINLPICVTKKPNPLCWNQETTKWKAYEVVPYNHLLQFQHGVKDSMFFANACWLHKSLETLPGRHHFLCTHSLLLLKITSPSSLSHFIQRRKDRVFLPKKQTVFASELKIIWIPEQRQGHVCKSPECLTEEKEKRFSALHCNARYSAVWEPLAGLTSQGWGSPQGPWAALVGHFLRGTFLCLRTAYWDDYSLPQCATEKQI